MSKALDAHAPTLALANLRRRTAPEQVAGEGSRARRFLERLDQIAFDKAFGSGLAAT